MYNLLIGGAAGQGIDTTAAILRNVFGSSGYNIFTTEDIMSRIRGGHNFSLLRFGDTEVYAHSKKLDGIVALNEETIGLHINELDEKGFIICDEEVGIEDHRIIRIKIKETAEMLGNPKVSGTIAAGAIVKIFSINKTVAEEAVKSSINKEHVDINMEAINKGYNMVESKYMVPSIKSGDKLLLNGNEAIALGAVAAGIRFYSAYPMSPSTSIMGYLAAKSDEAQIVVEQAEDEIAAINMAIGASYAGALSMTGTSGGGFSLMVEALGLSGMAEIPLVIVDVQRPGPATGFPTRTEQGDLKFVISASHGEFPRMVIAIRNHEDGFYQTVRAFNMALKYQIPVIILSDQYLADAYSTVKPYDLDGIARGDMTCEDVSLEYLRYRYTDDGISPRLIPGKTKHIVAIDSDEHDESGVITESAEVRINMTDKRMKKMAGLERELMEPEFIGNDDFQILLVAFGSMEGPVKEALETLKKTGTDNYAALVFGDVFPMPKKLILEKAARAKGIINIEQNATGQLASLIREETGIVCSRSILKYDGRQITGDEIVRELLEEV